MDQPSDLPTAANAPSGSPVLPDAAPEPEEPAVIRRKDYAPFAWRVPAIRLDFDLGIETTRVKATLTVEPNPDAEAEEEIRLDGDGLVLERVHVDGEERTDWRRDGEALIVPLGAGEHTLTIVTRILPSENTQLMGLYASNGMLCTQCEAEGFRRITFFPDRPDVLSVYTVRMAADRKAFPILLSNGNPVEEGVLEDGRHFAEWHDPWPKPSYLFALVAGDLVARTGSFTTMSGREVALGVWVREEDLPRTSHAMESIKRSMKWDEETFGREYDLDRFNIVAVGDFNMGAMENKGLNIFNTKYVLADEETATDADFDAVEGVIGHEYFHNWSGNRITCRDWFQLSLKEGFTVLRDQLFSEDMHGAAVKRIGDVRVLRSVQFPEDSGPFAHPIRPDSYKEISNFYTATVYNKGAEVIRMMRSMAGIEAFRKGSDLYFERHDGEAATCEDFVRAMEDGAGLDLTQFRRWYEQAGTPQVTAEQEHEGETVTLVLKQVVPPTPGQPEKSPVPIPLRIALFDRESGDHSGEQLIVLTEAEQEFSFEGFAKPPILSINRGYTAPIALDRDISRDDLVFLAAHDDDSFARHEAMQELLLGYLLGEGDDDARAAIGTATQAVLADEALDNEMRAELLTLPPFAYLGERSKIYDPGAMVEKREGLKVWLGQEFAEQFRDYHERLTNLAREEGAQGKQARRMRSLALGYIAAADEAEGARLGLAQYRAAAGMTERQGALAVLAGLDGAEREEALADFYARFADNPLVVDKWFTLQATSLRPNVLEEVEKLARHEAFTISNPNRVRSLYGAMSGNPVAFHQESGAGYRMIADLILELNLRNPQLAARFVPSLGRWRRVEPGRSALMRAELERIAAAGTLSRDVAEQVEASLG
ncbi:MAG: aminopeptidase N [Citromicrobium sp.]|nr:aminopeptidase N [Citromicrobium sp.]MAO95905.1 aminopeptidase N [Citromicrobium sp.]MBD75849.1 aminopeptidase N [Citromicrobium sp.]MBT48251.1 aminopeptidase N [Citromicrobium sp.]|tara:strand:- start:981 stop:3623 length:2643 start_codon:yes stop_codon:yes gene_type:complete